MLTPHSRKTNASLRGKNTFTKMLEGRKQQTYFCPTLTTYKARTIKLELSLLNTVRLYLIEKLYYQQRYILFFHHV